MNFSLQERRNKVVAASLVTQFMVIGTMFAYGVFFKELEAEFGWSRTLLSAASSVAMLFMGLFAFVGGRMNERFGPRIVLSVTGLCFGLGYALLAFMNSPWQLLVLYGLFVGIGLATHDVVTLSTIAGWFPKRRGIMTGIVKTGTAFGQVILPPAAAILSGAVGWRMACVVLGVSAAALLLTAAQSMRAAPAATTKPSAPKQSQSTKKPAVKAARNSNFWLLCAIQASFFPVLTTIPLHIIAHGTDLGLTPTTAAYVLSTVGASSIAGRLLVGAAVDKVGGRNAYLICFVVLLSSLVLLRFNSNASLLFLAAVPYGFAHGGLFTVVSPTIAEYFDMKSHSSVFGSVVFWGTLGGAAGPLLAGQIYDHTGSYNLAFSVLIGSVLLGLILVLRLKKPQQRA